VSVDTDRPAAPVAVPHRLRILHVVNMGTTCGGAERLLAGAAAAQRAAGHQVRVLSSDLPGSGTRFNDVAWPQTGRSAHWAARLLGQLRNPAAAAALAEQLREFRPDVVHLHTVGLLAPASLPVLAGTPTVLTVHGSEIFVRGTERFCIPDRYYRRGPSGEMTLTVPGRLVVAGTALLAGRAWRRELRVVDVTLAPSRYLATLTGRDLGRTRVVPNGYTPASLPVVPGQPAPHRPSVVFAGRLEHFKGAHVALAALPAILARHPGARLSICGSGPMADELRTYVREHGLAGHVDLTGWLPADDVQRRYATADVVVVPSVWPESFGLTVLEAFAAGTPVVASDVGGLPDLVRPGETGTLVPPHDPTALADAVSDLLDDEPRRRRFGQAARAVHAELTLDRHVSTVHAAYREAITAPRRREPGAHRAAAPGAFARFAGWFRHTKDDSLLRNSALLLLSTLVLAGGGFLFWRIVTHLVTADEVGRAGSLISASTLVVNLALLGLNNSLIRYLGEWPDRARTVSTAISVVALAALAGAVFVALALPSAAPGILGAGHLGQSLAFVALCVTGAVGLCYDNVFVALRRSDIVLSRNLIIVALRLALPLLLAGSAAFGIFSAYWLAPAAALPLYYLAARRLGLRTRFALGVERLRAMWRYSAANYMATAILTTPSLLMPVLVAHRIGPGPAGEYYIASLLAGVLIFVPQATARSFFAEVSHDRASLRGHLTRVVKVTTALQIPVLALVVGCGQLLLRLFGQAYVGAYPLLILLALTGALSAVGFIGSTLLLVAGRTKLLCQLSAAAYAVSLIGAYLLAGRGLIWIGGALLVGEILLAAGYVRIILGELRDLPGRIHQPGATQPAERTSSS
jgi:glycosyltransferase involved in cell wall biosynthesis/O-antigen/teichoic acid export membrane protein